VLRSCGPILFVAASARISNEHKACLDQVALSLGQDPRSQLVIDGHRDSSERAGTSLTRATNSRDYLVTEKGIDSKRITVRDYGDTCPDESGGPRLNRRVEPWVIPAGANVSDVNAFKRCAPGSAPRLVNEPPAKPTESKPARKPGRTKPGATADLEDEPVDQTRPRSAEVALAKGVEPIILGRNAAIKATTLERIRTKMTSGTVRVYIDTDGAADYRDFKLAGPSRIVVDLPGVRSGPRARAPVSAGGLVERVRTGEPEPGTTRVVLDLNSPVNYRVTREGSSLVIIVGETRIAAKAAR
jgi:hypothetical protein